MRPLVASMLVLTGCLLKTPTSFSDNLNSRCVVQAGSLWDLKRAYVTGTMSNTQVGFGNVRSSLKNGAITTMGVNGLIRLGSIRDGVLWFSEEGPSISFDGGATHRTNKRGRTRPAAYVYTEACTPDEAALGVANLAYALEVRAARRAARRLGQ